MNQRCGFAVFPRHPAHGYEVNPQVDAQILDLKARGNNPEVRRISSADSDRVSRRAGGNRCNVGPDPNSPNSSRQGYRSRTPPNRSHPHSS